MHMSENKIKHYRSLLEQEHARLELELTDLGAMHRTQGPGIDVGAPTDMTFDPSDESEEADLAEEEETNEAIAIELNARLEEVAAALKRIEDGTYGICEETQEMIEDAVLNANPTSRRCMRCI
jgi:RNA polymerase-binding transcription factor DksA